MAGLVRRHKCRIALPKFSVRLVLRSAGGCDGFVGTRGSEACGQGTAAGRRARLAPGSRAPGRRGAGARPDRRRDRPGRRQGLGERAAALARGPRRGLRGTVVQLPFRRPRRGAGRRTGRSRAARGACTARAASRRRGRERPAAGRADHDRDRGRQAGRRREPGRDVRDIGDRGTPRGRRGAAVDLAPARPDRAAWERRCCSGSGTC